MAELTLERLAKLELLEREATPGPWVDVSGGWGGKVWRGPVETGTGFVRGKSPEARPLLECEPNEDDEDEEQAIAASETDAALIAAMRNELPALLTAARRLLELENALTWQMRNGSQGKYGDPAGTQALSDEQLLTVWFSGLRKLGWPGIESGKGGDDV